MTIRPKLQNGKVMQPYGHILTRCEFGVEPHMKSLGIACEFVVFTSLVQPGLMMGRHFLGFTATLLLIYIELFVYRSSYLTLLPHDLLAVLQLHYTAHRRKGRSDGCVYGSYYDLMSERFALDRKFEVTPCQMSFKPTER